MRQGQAILEPQKSITSLFYSCLPLSYSWTVMAEVKANSQVSIIVSISCADPGDYTLQVSNPANRPLYILEGD